MTKQLTLISVPAVPARPDAGDPAADVSTADRSASAPPTVTHRRSADHTGWLDRRTISTGRKGVAAARAALADATQRVAERQALEEADRTDRLAREASGIRRSDRHAA